MSNRSKQVSLDEASPGMVLSSDLLTNRGKLVLPKGAVLTETALASLRRYEVQTLMIQLSDELSAAEEAAERLRFQERITSLFRKSDGDKIAGLLKQYVTNFRSGSDT